MIPILYKEDAIDFSTFGIGVLADTISCLVTEERNGAYELTLKYPLNGSLYGEIKKERIIKAKPNDLSDPQAFRIYRITIPINGIITIYAEHISYDLINIGVIPFYLLMSCLKLQSIHCLKRQFFHIALLLKRIILLQRTLK